MPEQGDDVDYSDAQQQATSGARHCNCKKSRCLKLYCECFSAGRPHNCQVSSMSECHVSLNVANVRSAQPLKISALKGHSDSAIAMSYLPSD